MKDAQGDRKTGSSHFRGAYMHMRIIRPWVQWMPHVPRGLGEHEQSEYGEA